MTTQQQTHLKLFPEALFDFVGGFREFAQLPHSTFDFRCVDARRVQWLVGENKQTKNKVIITGRELANERLESELNMIRIRDAAHCQSTSCTWRYLFELENRPQGLYHGVLLVVLYQVGQGVKLLTSTDVVLQVLLKKER